MRHGSKSPPLSPTSPQVARNEVTALERLLGLRADLLRPLGFNGAKTPELIGTLSEAPDRRRGPP